MKKSSIVVCALAYLLIASACFASEFSAKYTEKQGPVTRNGIEYVKGENVRQVVAVTGSKQVIISRQDLKVTWELDMKDKTYIEFPNAKGDLSKQIAIRAKRLADTTKSGTETIQNQLCDKYTFTYKMKEFGVGTQWVSQKIGWPIKTEIKSKVGDTLVELKDIKIEVQPDKLFEIPKGFRKIESKRSQPKINK